jgi:hypothetical protein
MSVSVLAVTDGFKSDLVAQAKTRATSPLRAEFARLLETIEASGQRVQELEQLQSIYRAKFGQILPPLLAEQVALSQQIVLSLHQRLQRPDEGRSESLTANHRKAIGRVIVSLSLEFALQGDVQMRAIHDLYSNETIEEMNAANIDAMLDLLNTVGVKLPERTRQASAANMAQAARQALQARMAQQEEVETQRKARRDEKRAAKAKADPAAQAKLEQKEKAAQEAQSALKNIYRQLARQLHPDRAESDAQRLLHHDLMSDANTAYERQDLLALLKLQLKAQQIDASAIGTVAEDKLKAWVALLRAQAKDLSSELAALEMQVSQEFCVPRMRGLTVENLEASLKATKQDHEERLHLMRHDLQLVKTDAHLKRWAKANSKGSERHDSSLGDDWLDTMLVEQMMNNAADKQRKRRR